MDKMELFAKLVDRSEISRNRYFPEWRNFQDHDERRKYLNETFALHCHKRFKKRLAKKVISMRGGNVKNDLTVAYVGLRWIGLGMVIGDEIVETMNRPSFSRRIFGFSPSCPDTEQNP